MDIEKTLNETAAKYTTGELTFRQVLREYARGNCSEDLVMSIIEPSVNAEAEKRLSNCFDTVLTEVTKKAIRKH